ncbi:ABC transporter substrate-binding protein [Staphylococcus aureus]|uniref:ABC transporter substrate-binding protein n=1 Tax=Staphylococcus aureus TaxID=1280 RepID=A0A380E104_STAAU|nr:ABC transporter substrate-binding protein [Staphylococcus aureus]
MKVPSSTSQNNTVLHQVIFGKLTLEKQGTPEQMRQAIEFVKKHKLKTLIVETSVDKKAMESLSEETKKISLVKCTQIQSVKKALKVTLTTK